MRNIRLVTVLTLVGAGLLLGPEAASAQTCIEDVWQAHGNSNHLQCTANDVTLSAATNIVIITGGSCDPVTLECGCFAGGDVTFRADFRMDLTTQARYDVGFYIATDSDPNGDGALTGLCSATASLSSNTTRPGNFINLDAAPDVCGESTAANNPVFVTATITAACPTSPGEQLQLPFATTWRQPGSNEVCLGTGNGTTTNDVFPGAPSKCNAGVLTIPIIAVDTTLEVTKDALTTSVPETGGPATYQVTVTNTSQIAVTLTSLTDDPFGDITALTGSTCAPDANPATCQVGATLAPGASCSCMFTAQVPAGDVPGSHVDTVEACANNPSNLTPVCETDPATVPYTDVSVPPTLTKTVGSNACRIDTTYNVVVTNGNALESLTLNTLTDDVFGNITTVQGNVISTTCGQASGAGALPFVIPPAGTYPCSFVGRTTSCNTTVHDTVTGGTVDEDGVPFAPQDDATVVITVTP